MRAVCFIALVLLGVVVISSTEDTSALKHLFNTTRCCTPEVNHLKWKRIVSYFRTSNKCEKSAFWVNIKNVGQRCANAANNNIIKAINAFDKHKGKVVKPMV